MKTRSSLAFTFKEKGINFIKYLRGSEKKSYKQKGTKPPQCNYFNLLYNSFFNLGQKETKSRIRNKGIVIII